MKPPEPMTNAETVENLLKLASKSPSGCFVEIGVGHGGTSYLLYKIADEQGRQLHLFDYNLDDNIKKWCPKAALHQGKYPDTWSSMSNIGFCFYDISDIEGANFLMSRLATDFVKKGIALIYPSNKSAIDYKIHPDWSISGRGNMRYPYVENRLVG